MKTPVKGWIVPEGNPTALVNPTTQERIAFQGQDDCRKALELIHETALSVRQEHPAK